MSSEFGFELIRTQQIAELNTQAQLWRHVQTGAELLSLENDDENKVFGVTFATPPADSTGIAHILEHSVLGGSQKYPLKEPFVELVKGSLNTFLNAFTSPDRTSYPVASTNLQDFYNLVDVYLDAVFHPLLTPHHLDQEGWHYELERPEEALAYRGVVFNEMKGVYSSPDSLLYRASQRALFPDNAYAVDSGGDPQVIPQLTYDQFKQFHTTYYHPTNARIWFYGDDDPAERRRILDQVLSDFQRAEVDSQVALHAPFAAPRQVTESYGVDADADLRKKAMVQVNWALPELTANADLLALSVLSYAMIGTQASPLRKALVDSGLGEDVTGGGFGAGLRQPTCSVGMKGIDLEDAGKVETLIDATLAQLAERGFEADMVEAAVNSIEFSLRENNTGSYPRGLGLYMRTLRPWLNGGDPIAPLAYEAPLAEVKQRLATDPGYLPGLLRTYLLDNPHRVTVTLAPSTTLNAARAAEETARLADAKAAMTPAEIERVVANTRFLKAYQARTDAPEDLAKLPRLTLADLERTNKPIPREVFDLADGGKLLHHDLFTNGVVYLRVGFDLRALPTDLLPYAEFFGKALLEMGTAREDYVKFSQRIGRKTGGVSYGTLLAPTGDTPDGVAWFFVSGKATVEQADELLAIVRDMLTTVQLDNLQRFKQIVLKSKARLEASLVPAGHSYVAGRLRAAFTTARWAEEQLDGIDHLFFVRRLAEEIDRDWPAVLARLEAVKRLLVSRDRLIVDVTLDGENFAHFQPQLTELIASLPQTPGDATPWQVAPLPAYEGLAIPAQVNYVGKGGDLYRLGYQFHGSVRVITNFLRMGYLWERIRVTGGAYGAFCAFDKYAGVFSFVSYRDPNLANTLAVYDGAADFLRTATLDDGELTKNIIGAISDLDRYQLPDAKGYSSLVRYLTGETEEMRQQTRDEILGATPADFRAFADVLGALRDHSRVVVMGSPDALTAPNVAPALSVTRLMA
jgi:Zn-dependent M16 (insulinase) family peptidase